MILFDEKMFTSTQYLFNVSTTWQYMVLAAGAAFILWIFVSILEKLASDKVGRIIEKYIYRPILWVCSFVISVGAFFYLIVVLKDYIWGVG